MATTEILPFGTAVGANVMTPADYAALTARLNGFSAGIAESVQLNTVWRQSAFMAAALANFMVSQGISQLDDGNLTQAVTNIQTAFKSLVGSPNVFTGATTTGSANAQVLASVTPATGFALNNGYTVVATAGYTNTGATTYNVAGSGVQTVKKLSGASLVALAGGEIVSGANFSVTWNSTASVWVLQTTPPLGALAYLNAGFALAPDGSGNLKFNGTKPTYTVLTSGSGTYTTPAGCIRVKGRMVAAGGGGGGAGTLGSDGGDTTFGSTTCKGGSGGGSGNAGGNGGSGGVTSGVTQLVRLSGARGSAGNGEVYPSVGGASPFGCAGVGAVVSGLSNGNSASNNSGSGGAGAVDGAAPSKDTRGAGGAGEYLEFVITSPSATYSYAVGAGGAGGTGTYAGGAGGSGIIILEEIYY